MNFKTLVQFLFGYREAILRVASCPSALWVGLLFVFAAGVAREYDGEDLLHEPWHLLIPVVASLVTSVILFLLVRFVAWIHGAVQPSILKGYRVFLTLYWMTAPLALLYAIPFERWLTAGNAAQANLWLLAIVAVWRVILMARIIAVLYTTPFLSARVIVFFFADTVLLTALSFAPVPVLGFMGGVRLSPAESVIQGTSFLATAFGMLAWPVLLLALLGVVFYRQQWQYTPVESATNKVTPGLWAVSVASLCMLLPFLPFTQRQQWLRHQVETELRAGNFSPALELMSQHTLADFPPHWDPPPRIAYRQPAPDINDLLEHITTSKVAPWVLDLYAEKYANWLHGHYFDYNRHPSVLERQLTIIQKLPNRKSILQDNQHRLTYALGNADEPLKARLERMLSEAGIPLNREPKSESQTPRNGPAETPTPDSSSL
jgi:hypothetical protein